MIRRSKSPPALEAQIREAREGIERDEHARQQSLTLASQAKAERRAVADDPAAFEELERSATRHASEARRLALVLERRQADLAQLEHALEEANYAVAYQTLEAAAARRADVSKRLSSSLATAIRAISSLERARDEYDSALASCHELLPHGVDFELPANADEIWPDRVDELVAFLKAGPRQPLTKAEADRARTERERKQREATEIGQAVRAAFEGNFVFLDRLSPELEPKARDAVRKFAATITRDSEAQARSGETLDEAGLERNVARTRERIEAKERRILERLGDKAEAVAS